MAERPKHWIKLWVSWLTTPAHLELSGGALGLGPLLLLLATWDGEYESGGWLLGEDGKPYDKNALARATHRTRAELDRQMLELVRVGTVVIDGRGAYGFARFGKWQETRDAKRMRVKRANGSPNGTPNSSGQRSLDVQPRRQTTDDRRELATQEPPPTPASGGRSRRGKPRADYDPAIEQALAESLTAACTELGRRGPRKVTDGMRDALRKLFAAEEPTVDEIRHVVAVRAAMDSRGEGYGELSWEHLCRPANFQRYRDREVGSRRPPPPTTPSGAGRVGRDVDDVIADREVGT